MRLFSFGATCAVLLALGDQCALVTGSEKGHTANVSNGPAYPSNFPPNGFTAFLLDPNPLSLDDVPSAEADEGSWGELSAMASNKRGLADEVESSLPFPKRLRGDQLYPIHPLLDHGQASEPGQVGSVSDHTPASEPEPEPEPVIPPPQRRRRGQPPPESLRKPVICKEHSARCRELIARANRGEALPYDFPWNRLAVPTGHPQVSNQIRLSTQLDASSSSSAPVPYAAADYELQVWNLEDTVKKDPVVDDIMKDKYNEAFHELLKRVSSPDDGTEQLRFFDSIHHQSVDNAMWAAVLHNKPLAVEMLSMWYRYVADEVLANRDTTAGQTWAMVAARLGYFDLADQLFTHFPCDAVRGRPVPSEKFLEVCRNAEQFVAIVPESSTHVSAPPSTGLVWRLIDEDTDFKSIANIPHALEFTLDAVRQTTVVWGVRQVGRGQ
ncbi:hypothetical protein IWQ60_002331 [Tieghemiomyces parasiticus]|uniref:Secreted protein n=1 Tax=Tieghemiomyces parasiticus TaxID=78921 RepID=A0A9W8AJN2_9FUNG|nr:hypothetical protein IWQ60_002331 [Tieghemiomyces parasiticus]